jgi:exopolysaccharide biosynthesis polyprenyl glycosylphosphotransferase
VIRLFKISVPGSVVALIISEAVLLFSCYLVAAYLTLDAAPDVFLLDADGLWSIALVVLVIIAGLYFADLYQTYRIQSRIELIQQYCLVLGVTFLVQALLNYGRWDFLVLPKWTMVYGSALALVLTPAWRIAFTRVVWKAVGARRILFVGSSPAVREIIQEIDRRPELALSAIGYLDNDEAAPPKLFGVPRRGAICDLDAVVAADRPDAIVVGLTERRGNLPVDRLLDLRLSGIYVEEAASTYETVFHRVSTRDLRPSHLVFSAELGPSGASLTLQGAYSMVLALIALIPGLPIMLVVAILVRLTSRGPVLFRQTRVGHNGAIFTMYKFRSMREDAEAKTGAIWSAKNDPRATPLGRWLRTLRLDELPQLFNVVRGDMSIVGPRPERPEFVSVLREKIPYYVQRLCVRPGITGLAQISYKYGDTIEDTIVKLEYDLYYIKNLSWSLDMYIIFHTAKTMLFGRGSQ